MDEDDRRENELEQELDQLYRKVAGDAPPEERAPKGKDTTVDLKAVAEAISASEWPAQQGKQRARKPRASFRFAPVLWGLLGVVLALALFTLFYPAAVNRHSTAPSGGGAAVGKRPADEGAALKDKEGRSYPLPPEAIILPPMEEAKAPAPTVAPTVPSFTVKGKEDKAAPRATEASRGSPQVRYAVQIRAYPENQGPTAIAFLEELRKKNPDAALETVSIPGRGVWHRILLGDFASDAEAGDYRQGRGVARDYPNSFIQKKSGAPGEPKTP
jgi:hypothetical protein